MCSRAFFLWSRPHFGKDVKRDPSPPVTGYQSGLVSPPLRAHPASPSGYARRSARLRSDRGRFIYRSAAGRSGAGGVIGGGAPGVHLAPRPGPCSSAPVLGGLNSFAFASWPGPPARGRIEAGQGSGRFARGAVLLPFLLGHSRAAYKPLARYNGNRGGAMVFSSCRPSGAAVPR